MAGSIRLYGGVRSRMPVLAEREPGYCVDTGELFIGTGEGSALLASRDAAQGRFEAVTINNKRLETGSGGLTFDGRELAYKAPALPPLGEDAGAAELVAAYNALLESLKNAGTMEEA